MAIPEGKIFDADKMEFVDKPTTEITAEKPGEEKEVPKEEEVEEEIKEEDKPADDAPSEDAPAEEEQEEKIAAEASTEEEQPVEQIEIDDYVKEKFAGLGIESEADLDEKIAVFTELESRNKALETELAELKASAGKPKFTSEQEEKAFEFLKTYDVTRMGEGMQTLARVVTMDVEKSEPRILLEEEFIIKHPELTREESLRKFNKDYKKKFELDKDSFDTEEKYQEELADVKIEEKMAVSKAKKFLAEKQKEYRSAPKQVEEAPKENPVVKQTIDKTVKELDGYMSKYQGMIFAPTENEKDNITIDFTKEQNEKIHNAAKGWVSNPASYNAKGELEGGGDLDEQIKQVAYALYGDDIVAKMFAIVMNQADIKQADKIAKIKPTREVKTTNGKVDANISEEKQWEKMLRMKNQKKGQQSQVYQ